MLPIDILRVRLVECSYVIMSLVREVLNMRIRVHSKERHSTHCAVGNKRRVNSPPTYFSLDGPQCNAFQEDSPHLGGREMCAYIESESSSLRN